MDEDKPCPHGHGVKRTPAGNCPMCTHLYMSRYFATHPERLLTYSQRYYLVSLLTDGGRPQTGIVHPANAPLRKKGYIIKSQGRWTLTAIGQRVAEAIKGNPTLLQRPNEEKTIKTKDNLCPLCDSDTDQMDTCPTIFDGEGWFEHFPTCGEAIMYFCLSVDCDWEYRWGMNRDNPAYANNEQLRPYWLRAKPVWSDLANSRCHL